LAKSELAVAWSALGWGLLRSLSVAAGCLLLYVAFFIYEDEQKVLQNVIETAWIRIHDASQGALRIAAQIFSEAAELLTRALDRLFGERTLSLQAFAVSYNLANVSGAILSLIFLGRGKLPNSFGSYFLFDIAYPLLLALVPALLPHRRWAVWISCIPMLGGILIALGGIVLGREAIHDWLGTELLAGMTGSIGSSLALVAVDRKVLKWTANRGTAASAIVAGVLNALLLIAVLGGSIVWVADSSNLPGWLSSGPAVWFAFTLAWMSLGNLCPAMIAFGVLALVVMALT
jgi:hypothetical protein